MNDDRSQARDAGETDEPELTQKNSRTISGEEILADESTELESRLTGETGTRAKLGVIPSSYGAAGGTTDAYEEGAGEHEGEGTGI